MSSFDSSPGVHPAGHDMDSQAAEPEVAIGPGDVSSPHDDQVTAGLVDGIEREVRVVQAISAVPLGDHADVYQRVHGELLRALADIDGA